MRPESLLCRNHAITKILVDLVAWECLLGLVQWAKQGVSAPKGMPRVVGRLASWGIEMRTLLGLANLMRRRLTRELMGDG